jgi:uncharacterized membrane protein YcfT
MSANANRLQWVDMAKGISIILVVMMHSAFGVGEETGGTGVLHWIIGFATPFRMPEFFLISGLFLSMVIGRDWARFADRRVLHYFYFYALWAVLQIVFKVGLGAGDPGLALNYMAWAIVEPYGVLWFIYMLAVFSAVTKLLYQFKIPHWAVLLVAAGLQMAPVTSASYIITQFAEYYVYFYAGYALAPQVFKLADWAQANTAKALGALAAWAVVNVLLVFSPGFQVLPNHVVMGLGELPGVHLALAISGTMALCTLAALLTKLAFMDWLRWLGAHSIVVYLSFSIPMAMTRTVLVKLGFISNTSAISIIVLLVALVSPLVLYWLIEKTGYGKFLFERPAWAHIPGTQGARVMAPEAVQTPAE